MAVHVDARLRQAAHDVDGFSGVPVAHQLPPQLRVGGVNRDVDGRDAQVDDALDLPWGQVGEGHIVAQQKGQAVIIVLEIEGIPQPFGHLIHKAEDAVVGTPVGMIHQVSLKFQPQVLPLPLADVEGTAVAGGVRQLHLEAGVVAVKFVVQHDHHILAVDGHQGVTGQDTGQLARAAGIYGFNFAAQQVHRLGVGKIGVYEIYTSFYCTLNWGKSKGAV